MPQFQLELRDGEKLLWDLTGCEFQARLKSLVERVAVFLEEVREDDVVHLHFQKRLVHAPSVSRVAGWSLVFGG